MSFVEMMTDEEDKHLKDIRMKKIKLTKYGLNFANVCCKLVYDNNQGENDSFILWFLEIMFENFAVPFIFPCSDRKHKKGYNLLEGFF